jgi:hypothetical protein
MLSQKNIVSDMTNGMYLFAITPKSISILPPHHTFGSTVNFVGHFSQAQLIPIERPAYHRGRNQGAAADPPGAGAALFGKAAYGSGRREAKGQARLLRCLIR